MYKWSQRGFLIMKFSRWFLVWWVWCEILDSPRTFCSLMVVVDVVTINNRRRRSHLLVTDRRDHSSSPCPQLFQPPPPPVLLLLFCSNSRLLLLPLLLHFSTAGDAHDSCESSLYSLYAHQSASQPGSQTLKGLRFCELGFPF